MEPAEARAALQALLHSSPEPFPLDRAALLLSVEDYPGLEPGAYEARLDHLAERVGNALPAPDDADPRRRLGALRRVVFEEEGLHGNREQYYELRNSYLHEVLDRKLGIPITLAFVMLGVARRLEWPLRPVNFPAHVLVRYETPDEVLAVDPFHGGLILGPEELAERWRFTTVSDAPPPDRMLVPASPASMLLRMLNNIRLIHDQNRDYRGAASAVARMALVAPEEAEYDRAQGQYLLAAGEWAAAAPCLERFLQRAPWSPEADGVRRRLEEIRRRSAEW